MLSETFFVSIHTRHQAFLLLQPILIDLCFLACHSFLSWRRSIFFRKKDPNLQQSKSSTGKPRSQWLVHKPQSTSQTHLPYMDCFNMTQLCTHRHVANERSSSSRPTDGCLTDKNVLPPSAQVCLSVRNWSENVLAKKCDMLKVGGMFLGSEVVFSSLVVCEFVGNGTKKMRVCCG